MTPPHPMEPAPLCVAAIAQHLFASQNNEKICEKKLQNGNQSPVLVEFVLDTLETVTLPNEVPKIEVSPEVSAVTRASRASAAAVLSAPVKEMVSVTLTDDATTESMVTLASTSSNFSTFASSVVMNCNKEQHNCQQFCNTTASGKAQIMITVIIELSLPA